MTQRNIIKIAEQDFVFLSYAEQNAEKNFADLKFEVCATVFGTTFPTGYLNRSLIINNLIKVRSQPRRAIISQTTADYR